MTLKSWLNVGLTVVVSLATSLVGRAQTPELKPGDMAPNFSVKGSDGKTHSLADHKGKSAVVLAWFPKAFTGG
jgi:peroxiredoxin Q/BCP